MSVVNRGSMRTQLNPVGNARLTAVVGVLLLAPVAVELGTIVLGVHAFMSWHVFFGVALIPAVLLKLASTGWRFARYYTRKEAYLDHGAPQLAMRLLARCSLRRPSCSSPAAWRWASSTGMRS